MTAPAPDPRLVTLLSEHFEAIERLFSDDGNDSWLVCRKCDERIDSHMAHLAAEVEAHVQERIAEALEAVADEWDREAAESAARSSVADVRCLSCNLRYDERQEYGCHYEGCGHSYDAEELAEAAKPVIEPTYDGNRLRDRAAAHRPEGGTS
jgi:hypothetical protein